MSCPLKINGSRKNVLCTVDPDAVEEVVKCKEMLGVLVACSDACTMVLKQQCSLRHREQHSVSE